MSDTNLPARAPGTTIGPVLAQSPASPPPNRAALGRSLRQPVIIGSLTIAVFLGGLGLWGAAVPLAGGAIAPGVISPDGSRKKIQHLEGGIIGDIMVKDGDVVEVGQPLLVLEDTQARANYAMLLGQHRTLLATYSRLSAEQVLMPAVTFPDELINPPEPNAELNKIVTSQRLLFEARAGNHAARKKVLRQRIEQLGEQIKGLEAQVESATQQSAIIKEEYETKKGLLDRGLSNKPDVLRLQREQANIMGDRGEYVASIARARQQIGETELQLLAADAERADEIAKEMDKARADLAEVDERLFASADILKRTTIPAPVSGIVVNLLFKTKGGVVRPGEAMLEIVPLEDDLLIDAQLSPTDIDVVFPGMPAQVHLSAFTSRIMPRVDGVVRMVSADRIVDERTGQPYYLARVEVNREKLKAEIGPEIELVPGMPAEVLIVTGHRTMIDYMIQPLKDAFRRSFRET